MEQTANHELGRRLVARRVPCFGRASFSEPANDVTAWGTYANHSQAGRVVVEEYPDAHLGPSILVRAMDALGSACHAVWGMAHSDGALAVLVTAYRPDRDEWTEDFMKRITP